MSDQPTVDWQEAYELNTTGAREIADLVGIRADLIFVADVADRLAALQTDHPDSDVVLARALWSSGLVAYVRCFARNGKRLGLTEDDVEALNGPGALDLHKYQKDMRDKHIAHSVNPFESTTIGAMVGTSADGVSLGVIAVGVIASSHFSPSAEGATMMGRLARALLERVEHRMYAAIDDVLAEAQALDLEELRKRPPVRVTVPAPGQASQAREVPVDAPTVECSE